MRGTFANIRIKNEMLDGVEGGFTLGPDGQETSIFDAAMAYQDKDIPLVIFGGEQYGAGSSQIGSNIFHNGGCLYQKLQDMENRHNYIRVCNSDDHLDESKIQGELANE